MSTTIECKVCRGDTFKEVRLTPDQLDAAGRGWEPNHPYVQCAGCGLWIQFRPPVHKYESSMEEGNRKEIVVRERRSHEHMVRTICSLVGKTPNSILEVGCSYPLLLRLFKDAGCTRVLGVDGSNDLVEWGKELDVPVIHGDFLDLAIHETGMFDMSIMLHVIEHFVDPNLAMAKLVELVRPGGHMVFRTPLNDTAGMTTWHMFTNNYEVHPIVFGQQSMKKLFETHGLQVVNENVVEAIGHGDYLVRVP